MERKITASSTIDAQRLNGMVRPETVNLENRTVEFVFTTGQEGQRFHWDIGYYLESLEVSTTAIRQDRLKKGLSVIDNHDTYRGISNVHGITEEYRIENGELVGTVRFASDADSDVVFQKVVDGILRHCSLGYIVHRYDAILNAGEGLDTYRATDWEPTELSIVPVSFETNNGIRAMECEKPAPESLFPLQITITGEDTTMKFRNMLLKYRDPAKVDGDAAGGGNPAPAPVINRAADPAPAPAPAPVVVAPVAPVASDRGLITTFTTNARAAGFDSEHAVNAFSRGLTLEQYNAELLQAMSQRSVAQTPQVPLVADNRSDHKEQERNLIVTSILARNGMAEATAETRKFNGATLMDLARHVMGQQGFMNPLELSKRAFQSTSDFPLILENVMNKSLAAGYEETPRTFLGLGRRGSVNDFRAKHTYRMGDAPSLLPLGENGEYQSGTISEAKESFAIDTFARLIGFSRKMLINDDMGALTNVPRSFGQAGSRLESDVVWGLLLNYNFRLSAAANFKMRDGKTFFHADHNNLVTGAGSVLGEAALSTIRQKGRKMKTLDGNFMNIMWNTFVFPEELETDDEKLLINSIMATQVENINTFQGKYNFRVEPRLAVVSPTAFYGFTNMIDAFEYAYLAGEEGMYTEINNSTNVDGMEILVRKDFGAGYVDERGAVKSAGA